MIDITTDCMQEERIAKIFQNGRSQAVRLPAEFRFKTSEVYATRDPVTGNVTLSEKPQTWHGFFKLRDRLGPMPDDFLADRAQGIQDRDPFA